MRIELENKRIWEELNARLKNIFGGEEDETIRAHQGLGHAIFEMTMGTAQFLSHKRSLGVIKGASPFFTSNLSLLSREGFQMQAASTSVWDDVQIWADGLKKDTSFVLFSEDHAVTGEIYPWDRLDEILNEKKIFSIRISHQGWAPSAKLRPYSVRIRGITPTLAITQCGARMKSPTLVAANLPWDVEKELALVKAQQSLHEFKPEVVQKFLSEAQGSYQALKLRFPTWGDRAVLFSTELQGQSVQDELQKIIRALEDQVQTGNQCDWNTVGLFDDWWEGRPTDEQLRGLLILSIQVVQRSDLWKDLLQVEKTLQDESN